MSIKIILADDHQLMRQGLRKLLETEPEFTVVAEAANGRECVQLVKEHKPDIVVMDISMPNLNGVEATRALTKDLPQVKVMALSIHADEIFVDQMLKAGAVGYVLKDSSLTEMVEAIRTVNADKTYLSPKVADLVVKKYRRELPDKLATLTQREREVLQLIAEGKTAQEIASLLNVSVNTIATHRSHLLEKLNLKNTAELVKYAIRMGLTSL